MEVEIQFKLMEVDAQVPTRAHETDSGWDLYAYEDALILPKQTANIFTGVAVCAPPGWGYTIRGRSSLNKRGVQTALGTVDANYCGRLYALMYNVSDQEYHIKKGDRIAQIVFERVHNIVMKQVDEFTLPEGSRGAKGFGSSGR